MSLLHTRHALQIRLCFLHLLCALSTAVYAQGPAGPEAPRPTPRLVEVHTEQSGSAANQTQLPTDVSALCTQLNSPSASLKDKEKAASDIGPLSFKAKECVPALIELLVAERQKKDKTHRFLMMAVINALGRIGPDAAAAVPQLIGVLKEPTFGGDDDDPLRMKTAEALKRIGIEAKDAIPALTALLGDSEDAEVREFSADALGDIAAALASSGDASHLKHLRAAHGRLSKSNDPKLRNPSKKVEAAVEALDSLWLSRAGRWADTHPFRAALLALFPLLLLGSLLLLWLRPLWLLKVNERLAPYADVTLPAWLGGFKLPLRYAAVVGFFHYHPRVLDAWVEKHAAAARRTFEEKSVVEERRIHVPVPSVLDKQSVASLVPANLQPLFSKNAARLLIRGEGGSGKTSLACLLARWALEERAADRLCPTHRMLPILLEQDVEPVIKEGEDPFLEVIKDQLRGLIDQPEVPATTLVERLLRHRRLLVVIDGMSEMSGASQQHVNAGVNDFANAIVVTSRADEALNNLPRSTLRPMRIRGDKLSSFMEAYLQHREKRELFNDREFFEACGRLSTIVGERDVTPLLAKYYADHLIAAKEGAAGDDTPQNIPDLMLNYINVLHRPAPTPDLPDVIRAAEVVAWECLKEDYRPAPAALEGVLAALGGEKGRGLFDYMEATLRIIQVVGAGRDRVRFALDPLSEYLAGLHLVRTYAKDEPAWREFMRQADSKPGAPESIKGFLLALRDCCVTKGAKAGVPAFVSDELARRTTQGGTADGGITPNEL